jgi:hypothetical protein
LSYIDKTFWDKSVPQLIRKEVEMGHNRELAFSNICKITKIRMIPKKKNINWSEVSRGHGLPPLNSAIKDHRHLIKKVMDGFLECKNSIKMDFNEHFSNFKIMASNPRYGLVEKIYYTFEKFTITVIDFFHGETT